MRENVIRHLVRSLAAAAGYRLVRKGAPLHSYRECLTALSRRGLQPRTVFDVGVADGTPELYDSFPGSRLVLIEPVEEYRARLEQICRTRNASYVLAAAGARDGTATLSLGHDARKSSTLRHTLRGGVTETRTVPAVTLDRLCLDLRLDPPYVIKADVEGGELDVLAGAAVTLTNTELVILEVTVCDTVNQAPEFSDVVSFMKGTGFVVHDIVGAAAHQSTGGLRHVDLVFVREGGRFRDVNGLTTQR